MSIHFTADHHFGHSNIIKYCSRPFTNSWEMNNKLIENWNARVQQTDTVYHLGDVSILRPERTKAILDKLNGKIFLIRGNHEKRADSALCRDRFEWIKDYHFATFNGGISIALFHYALRVWNKHRHGAWHLYGHSHGKLPASETSFALDVGVDCWNYKPVSLFEIRDVMEKRGWKGKNAKSA